MINEPSSRFSNTEVTKDAPVFTLKTYCWICTCMKWVSRCSARDFAEFICEGQGTGGCTDTQDNRGIVKGQDGFLDS